MFSKQSDSAPVITGTLCRAVVSRLIVGAEFHIDIPDLALSVYIVLIHVGKTCHAAIAVAVDISYRLFDYLLTFFFCCVLYQYALHFLPLPPFLPDPPVRGLPAYPPGLPVLPAAEVLPAPLPEDWTGLTFLPPFLAL